jgi:hypothetical protein
MRTTIFAILCALATPAVAAPEPDAQAQRDSTAPTRKPASQDELDRYEQRERAAQKQKQFQGGRMRNSDLVTIILILVIVILVLAIV